MSFFRKIGFLAATSVALIGVSIASLSLFQSKLIYMPRTYDQMLNYYSRFISRKDIKPFQFYSNVNSHIETHTAYHMCITPDNPSSDKIRLFLMFGGNAALALDFVPVIDEYKQHVKALGILDYIIPTHFLLIDYPGYNRNPGDPSPRSILNSTELALKQLIKEQQWKNKVIKLGFAAHSLGCASTLQFADLVTRNNDESKSASDMKEISNFSENNTVLVDKIILLSPFTTMLEMAQTLIGRIPFLNYLLNHNFDNVYHLVHFIENAQDKKKKLNNNSNSQNNKNNKVSESDKIQLLIIHGDQDRIVPVEMGRQLALIASNPEFSNIITCNYLELEGVDHNDIFSHAQNRMFELMADNEFRSQ